MELNYKETDIFKKEFDKLSKRFRTLQADFQTAKIGAINLFHSLNINNNSVFELTGYNSTKVKLFKLKKFACKALKGKGVNSGIRLVYAFNISKQEIEFLEIYYKGNKPTEDKERLKDFIKHYK